MLKKKNVGYTIGANYLNCNVNIKKIVNVLKTKYIKKNNKFCGFIEFNQRGKSSGNDF